MISISRSHLLEIIVHWPSARALKRFHANGGQPETRPLVQLRTSEQNSFSVVDVNAVGLGC